MKDKILKFIEDNNLQFDGTGSDLNGNCLALVGYALYLDVNLIDLTMILNSNLSICNEASNNIEVIYRHGIKYGYATNWHLGKYKHTYKYEDILS